MILFNISVWVLVGPYLYLYPYKLIGIKLFYSFCFVFDLSLHFCGLIMQQVRLKREYLDLQMQCQLEGYKVLLTTLDVKYCVELLNSFLLIVKFIYIILLY